MATATSWQPADTPTGLHPADLADLDDTAATALVAWHLTKAGDNAGRPWWPSVIRRMPLAERVRLANDLALDQAWEVRERRRVIADVEYFTSGYGHLQPEEGPPIPFDLWPEQRDALHDFVTRRRVVVLKARQVGMTWLALHYAAWVLAFNEHTPNARVLALSKHGGDASKLTGRVRRIFDLLPAFLRPLEETITRRSASQIQLVERGSMTSLAGTADAARMETATLALLDEFAFIRNRGAHATWTAVLGTLGRGSQAIVVSTGNGPAETPGDGQAFAQLWQQARSGDASTNAGLHAIFLPSSTHPDRDQVWRDAKREEFLNEEDFLAEYPETEEEALAGKAGTKVYSPAGINAAEQLGRALDTLLLAGKLRPSGGQVHVGVDWGEFSALLPIWPLEGGGIYVPPGGVAPQHPAEVKTNVERFHALTSEWWPEPDPDEDPVLFGEFRFDSADPQSTRTATAVIEQSDLADRWDTLRGRVRWCSVPFGSYKDETKDYLRHLFNRSGEGHTSRIIAISPTNRTLLRQLRGLEVMDDGTGRIRKGDDHAPDALIAGVAPIATLFRGRGLGREAS